MQQPKKKKENLFAKVQEALRKYIERTFGVLQTKWKIIPRPSNFMNIDKSTINMCVITLHNMWVEERLELDVLEKKEEIYADDIIVGGGFTPMWAGLERVSGREVVSASAGSIFRGL